MKKKIVSLALVLALILCMLPQTMTHANAANAPKVFVQYDSRWGSKSYGLSTIGDGGCGLLSLVNAVYYMSGNIDYNFTCPYHKVTEHQICPEFLARKSEAYGCRVEGVGTSHSFYEKIASNYGSTYGFSYSGHTTSWTVLTNHLQKGGTAIVPVYGHLMAIVDYNPNTKQYLLLDSYPSSDRKTSGTGYVWMTYNEYYYNEWLGRKQPDDFYMLKSAFVDVKDNDYFATPVDWAIKNNITNGTDTIHFSPSNTCNRAMFITFLWRANGCPNPASTNNPFSDIKKGDYYYNAALWAHYKGILKEVIPGSQGLRFSPNTSCTRAEAVIFIYRSKGSPKVGGTIPFTDVEKNGVIYDAVRWAVQKGVTNGTSATLFSPNKICTRAEIVTLLWRARNL